MSILVEGISVVVRRDAILSKVQGGRNSFVNLAPNDMYVADAEIARVSL
jgi:hypothetical protein